MKFQKGGANFLKGGGASFLGISSTDADITRNFAILLGVRTLTGKDVVMENVCTVHAWKRGILFGHRLIL